MHRGIHRHALAHVRCGRKGWGTHRSFPVHAEHWIHHGTHEFASDPGGGSFGVRRPLRFLAYKLGLSEEQVVALARILDELKTGGSRERGIVRRSQGSRGGGASRQERGAAGGGGREGIGPDPRAPGFVAAGAARVPGSYGTVDALAKGYEAEGGRVARPFCMSPRCHDAKRRLLPTTRS